MRRLITLLFELHSDGAIKMELEFWNAIGQRKIDFSFLPKLDRVGQGQGVLVAFHIESLFISINFESSLVVGVILNFRRS